MLLSQTGLVASVVHDHQGSQIVGRKRYHNIDQMWQKEGEHLICKWNWMALDIAEGQKIHMWPRHDGANQKWRLEDCYPN